MQTILNTTLKKQNKNQKEMINLVSDEEISIPDIIDPEMSQEDIKPEINTIEEYTDLAAQTILREVLSVQSEIKEI